MKLPFFVHHIVWDVADRLPFAFFVKSSGGHEDMKMWVVISGASCCLQYDNITDVEFLKLSRLSLEFMQSGTVS
jgi:hypothetical protein